MLTFEECLGFSCLTPAEIAAIAEHEHIPEIAAVEMGSFLLNCPEGSKRIKAMILEDIEAARVRGDAGHAAELRLVLSEFLANNVECR